MITLPYANDLRVDRIKVVEYLLSVSNSRGKAQFFMRFGFNAETWQELADALIAQGRSCTVVSEVESSYGTRYSVDGTIDTPSGRFPSPHVRTVWIWEPETTHLRLITAHPI